MQEQEANLREQLHLGDKAPQLVYSCCDEDGADWNYGNLLKSNKNKRLAYLNLGSYYYI
jgi:hypothetical protein